MNSYENENARCPYFYNTQKKTIYCGELDGAKVNLTFKSYKERKDWFADLCCDCYENCTLFLMMEDAYVE